MTTTTSVLATRNKALSRDRCGGRAMYQLQGRPYRLEGPGYGPKNSSSPSTTSLCVDDLEREVLIFDSKGPKPL
jgi:hypothetical protein